jgi:DNA-directed RNA polymerase subunit M/transcription elongation factor TFIIS
MKSIKEVAERHNSDDNFKKLFRDTMSSQLDSQYPEESGFNNKFKAFLENKDQSRFAIKVANLIDKIDPMLSQEMVGMETDKISNSLKIACGKLENKNEITPPVINDRVIRASNQVDAYAMIREEISNAGNEAARYAREGLQYGKSSPSKEFGGESFGDKMDTSAVKEFRKKMDPSYGKIDKNVDGIDLDISDYKKIMGNQKPNDFKKAEPSRNNGLANRRIFA